MSKNDLKRFETLTDVKEGRLKRSKGARILGISSRQLKRLLRRFRAEGPKWVVSKKVGAPSNNQLIAGTWLFWDPNLKKSMLAAERVRNVGWIFMDPFAYLDFLSPVS